MDEVFANVSLETALQRFGTTLAIDAAPVLRRGAHGAQFLLKRLKENGQDVDRAVVVGSLIPFNSNQRLEEDQNAGLQLARTNTRTVNINRSPHFDVVVFVNDKESPFQSTLCEFADIFFNAPEDIELVSTQHCQFIGIVFKGCRYDIFPATNHVKEIDEEHRLDYQRQRTLEEINTSDSPTRGARLNSPALAETALDFTTQQESNREITQSVITLAKFWLSQVNLSSYCILQRSYLVECIAIYATQVCSNTGRNVRNNNTDSDTNHTSLLQAFKKFLRLVTNFSTIKINFQNTPIPNCYKGYVGPLIVDPVNPYNNLAVLQSDPAKQQEVIRIFETAAMISLWKLDHLETQNSSIQGINEIYSIFSQVGAGVEGIYYGTSLPTPLQSPRQPRRVSLSGWIVFIAAFAFLCTLHSVRYIYRKSGWYPVGVIAFFVIFMASQFFLSLYRLYS